jgi:hypothetical protein
LNSAAWTTNLPHRVTALQNDVFNDLASISFTPMKREVIAASYRKLATSFT